MGGSPCYTAQRKSIFRLLESLFQSESNTNLEDRGKRTPLVWARMRGHPDLVNRLLCSISDNQEDIEDRTSLLHVRRSGTFSGSHRNSDRHFLPYNQTPKKIRKQEIVKIERTASRSRYNCCNVVPRCSIILTPNIKHILTTTPRLGKHQE